MVKIINLLWQNSSSSFPCCFNAAVVKNYYCFQPVISKLGERWLSLSLWIFPCFILRLICDRAVPHFCFFLHVQPAIFAAGWINLSLMFIYIKYIKLYNIMSNLFGVFEWKFHVLKAEKGKQLILHIKTFVKIIRKSPEITFCRVEKEVFCKKG